MAGEKGRIFKSFVLILLVLCMTGCRMDGSRISGGRKYTIGVVTKSAGSEYWMSVCSGVTQAAQDHGVAVRIVSPDEETNARMQNKMIWDLIDSQVDALAVSPIRSGEADYLETAREMQIPVYAFDTKILKGDVPYIGADNKKAGEALAKEMERQLGGTGKVGIISGDLEQTAHAERVLGIQEYFEENPGIEVSFVKSGYANRLMTEAEIAGLFAEYPQTDGIFVTSAVTALGLAEYLKDTQVPVMTVDAQQDALDALQSGRLAALVNQSGYEIGYETVRYIVEHKDDAAENQKGLIIEAELVSGVASANEEE